MFIRPSSSVSRTVVRNASAATVRQSGPVRYRVSMDVVNWLTFDGFAPRLTGSVRLSHAAPSAPDNGLLTIVPLTDTFSFLESCPLPTRYVARAAGLADGW